MKYLKVYESWTEYFTKLTKREFANIITKFEPIDLDKKDISEISKIITIEVPMRSMVWYNTKTNISNIIDKSVLAFGSSSRLNLYINDISYDFYIYKSTDEWYYVVVGRGLCEFTRKHGRQDGRLFILDEVGKPSYYKCDQLEGLIKLIKDFKIFKVTGEQPK